MTVYRVIGGTTSQWNAIKLKYGRDHPELFLKLATATASAATYPIVFLTTMEYRFLKPELDAGDMKVTVVKRATDQTS